MYNVIRRFSLMALLISLMLLLASAIVSAQAFSADIISKAGKDVVKGKLYVNTDKARFEMQEAVSITRIDKKVVWVLIPEEKMYMESKLKLENLVPSSDTVDGEIERVLLGKELIDGHESSKYRVVVMHEGKKSSFLLWIANDLGLPVKMAATDGSWIQEYKNIVIGSQPDELFEIPAGYQVFSMPMNF